MVLLVGDGPVVDVGASKSCWNQIWIVWWVFECLDPLGGHKLFSDSSSVATGNVKVQKPVGASHDWVFFSELLQRLGKNGDEELSSIPGLL